MLAVTETGSQAVHPWYGFLSENAVFVDKLVSSCYYFHLQKYILNDSDRWCILCYKFIVKYVLKSYPCNWLWRHTGLSDVETPTFLDSWYIDENEVVSLIGTVCPLPSGRFLVAISVRGWVDARAIMWLEGLGQLKNPMT
jgi:hypothetical protein